MLLKCCVVKRLEALKHHMKDIIIDVQYLRHVHAVKLHAKHMLNKN